MADLMRVRKWADALIALHLDPAEWSFGFDSAKTRAGLCNYRAKRITVSKYLATRFDDDEIHQVLLHEVAHALAGTRAGHGPKWKATARELGYVGARTHVGTVADELAPWVGTCPAGHELFRYRQPTKPMSCGRCARRFDEANLISWRYRVVTAAARRRAASSSG
ncbi:MAG TPA: SprT family zinc-dependent metalloprotease [Terrimesophilobacter sp.]|uniref:SprT family zinc-dependent metalloprotease n=1 Tax=Terrimesophilobacter sp. TaxID=2906435 RepID=UPI002F923E20